MKDENSIIIICECFLKCLEKLILLNKSYIKMAKGKKEGSINMKLNLAIKSGETIRGKHNYIS